jgi:hypothetical protein
MRVGSIAVAVALAVAVAMAGGTERAAAGCGGVEHFRALRDRAPGPPPLAVGDSVMLGAADELAAEGFEVDVRGCRQMSEGLDVLRARQRGGRLPEVVVVALGANWVITPAEIREALHILGRRRTLALVTPRETGGGSSSDAGVVRDAGRRYPGRVAVLDWVAYSAGHADWFAGDGLHLGPAGAQGLARLLSSAFDLIAPLEGTWLPAARGPSQDEFTPGGP